MRHYLGLRQHRAAITNSRDLLLSEADLLTVTKAGRVHEFEIKCTRSDYNRELNGKPRYRKRWKHQTLSRAYKDARIPNYFWFVTFKFEIEPPGHAGWILVDDARWGDGLQLYRKKKAPVLHAGKWDDAQIAKIARLLSFRLLTEFEKRYENGTSKH